MLRIERISRYEEFVRLRDKWDGIFKYSNNADNIFLTFEWIESYLKHFYKNETLLILNIFDDVKLIGIAPLMIRRRIYFGLPVRSVCFIGTDVSDRMDFLILDKCQEVIMFMLDYIMDIRDEWEIIDLQEITGDRETLKVLEKWLKNKNLLNIIGPSRKSFFIGMDDNKDILFRLFFDKFNKKLKRGKLYNLPGLNFSRYIGANLDADRLFSIVNAIEAKSWKHAKKTGIFFRNNSRSFHKEIFKLFSKNGWLDISLLQISDRPIAFIYNFLYRSHAYCYSTAFDNRYASFSPGTMLILWTLQDTFRMGIKEYDFIRGEDGWKERITKTFRIHQRVRIFNPSAYSRFLYLLQAKVMPNLRKVEILHSLWMIFKDMIKW